MIDTYTDYRKFMSDALDVKDDSRAELAVYLGISKSMLSQIIGYDRRVHPTLVSKVADYFELDEAGRSALAAMIDLDNDSMRARRSAWATIQARHRFLAAAKATDEATIQAMARWYVGAVHTLGACEGFRADPTWIAATLCPPITVEEADDALQTLVALGLFTIDDSGVLVPVAADIATAQQVPRGVRSMAIIALQRDMLTLASEALTRFRANERHSSVAMFEVPEEHFAALRVRLRELEQEVVDMASAPAPSRPNRVFALGVQLFPISTYTDVEPDGDDPEG